jgi:alanyl-tRNA synthetase
VLSVLPAELPAAIERLQAELKEQRKTIGRHQEALAVHEAARLLAAARDTDTRIVEVLEGWDAPGLKAIASAMTVQARVAVALFSATLPVVAVIARSTGVAVDSAAVLKELLQRFGGRGGGKPDLAQAGGLTGSVDVMCAAARQLLGR